MTVYRPAKSPYWHYDFQFRGVRYARSTGCVSKTDARRAEAEARRDAALPRSGKPPLTLDQAAELYAEKVDGMPSWSNTKRILSAMLAAIGPNRLLAEIEQMDLMRAVAKRRAGRANSSVNRELNVWRAVWRHAAKARFDCGDQPDWTALYLKVPRKAARTASHAEQDALFAAIRADHADWVRFALLSGWRVSEVVRLTWREVDLAARVARTRIKGGDVIERPLTNEMVALVANQPRVAVQVFTTVCQATRSAHVDKLGRKQSARVKGRRYPLSKNGWRKAWVAALTDAGIEGFTFHGLRHTRATQIVRTTGNLVAASKALGHRSIQTTMRYANADTNDQRNALSASESRNSPEMTDSLPGRKGVKAS